MCSKLKVFLIAAVAVLALSGATLAAADWPTTAEVGGFTINNIRGTTSPDGSGKASGRLMLPGGASCAVDLTRSSIGVITGSTRASFTIGQVRIDGSCILDRRGLSGAGGIVHTKGKPVTNAEFTVNATSGLTGRGQVRLSSQFAVPVSFRVSPQEVSVNGSAPRQATASTPLADYSFSGTVTVSSSGSGIRTTASGNVERRGKIGGMVSAFSGVTFEVDPQTGEATVNVGGSVVTLDLW